MRASVSVLAAILSLSVTSAASAAIVLPVTAFTPGDSGGGGNILANAVNNQPATVPTAGSASNAGHDVWAFFGDNRYGGLDFGADYALYRITDVFVLQRTFGTADATESYHWTNTTSGPFDAGDGDVAAPAFNLMHYEGTGGDTAWLNVFHSDDGVTPEGRYLILHRGVGGNEGNFKYQIAFVGEVVPEPASLGLLGLGGLMVLGRARRNA